MMVHFIEVREVTTGKLTTKRENCEAIAFRPGAKQLLVRDKYEAGKSPAYTYLWDLSSAQKVRDILDKDDDLKEVLFNHDGDLLALSSKKNPKLRVFDLNTGMTSKNSIDGTPVRFLSHRQILIKREQKNGFEISFFQWDFHSGKVVEIDAEGDPSLMDRRLPFSNPTTYLLIDGRYQKLRRPHGAVPTSLLPTKEKTHDGRLLVVRDDFDPNVMRVWDWTAQQYISRLNGQGLYGLAMPDSLGHSGSFSKEATLFAALAYQGRFPFALVWDVETGKQLASLPLGGPVEPLATDSGRFHFQWAPNGQTLIILGPSARDPSDSRQFVGVWQFASPVPTYLSGARVDSLYFNRDGSLLNKNDQEVWRIVAFGGSSLLRRSRWSNHPGGIVACAGADQVWVVKHPFEDELRKDWTDPPVIDFQIEQEIAFWQMAPREHQHTLPSPGYPEFEKFSQGLQNSRLERDSKIYEKVEIFGSKQTRNLKRVVYSPSGEHSLWQFTLTHRFGINRVDKMTGKGHDTESISTISSALELWDHRTGKRIALCADSAFEDATCFTFSPDGRRVATGSRAKNGLKIWNVSTGKLERQVSKKIDTRYIGYSSDGNLLLALGDKSVWVTKNKRRVKTKEVHVSIFDTATWKQLRSWKGTPTEWQSVAISPNGKWMASGSMDQLVRIWGIKSGHVLAKWQAHDFPVTALAFSPDGKTLVSGDANGTLKLWNLPYMRSELAKLNLDW